jgi:hypothetical protein
VRTTFVTCREHNSCVAILSVDPSGDRNEIAPPAWVEPWLNAQEGALVAIGHAAAVQTKHGAADRSEAPLVAGGSAHEHGRPRRPGPAARDAPRLAAAGGRQLIGYGGGAYQVYANGTVRSGGSVDTGTHVIAAVFNGASSKLYVDGGASLIAATTGTDGWGIGAAGIVYLGFDGTSARMNGKLGELRAWNSALANANLDIIGADLAAKWGTTWTAVV